MGLYRDGMRLVWYMPSGDMEVGSFQDEKGGSLSAGAF